MPTTRATVLLTEGVATVVAGCLGGVIQNTPYIGQPAYKAMGGRAAYTLATALFVGAAGYFGWFTNLFEWLPRAAMFPILVFVGIEITAQTFRATPARHYPALALAALPAFAALAAVPLNQALGGREPASPEAAVVVLTLRCLANGFIVTSLLWAASLAALLDRQFGRAALYLLVAAVFALFGIIHSPSSVCAGQSAEPRVGTLTGGRTFPLPIALSLGRSVFPVGGPSVWPDAFPPKASQGSCTLTIAFSNVLH